MATPVLETRHLTKVYDCLTAVDDLNLELRRGEILGFLGPNGAGKTTTINMICGLTRPTEGQVLFDGVGSKSRRHLSSLIGFCSQDTVLWESLTCLEQLTFMGEMHDISNGEARRRGRELLDEVGLLERENSLAKKLSGGMKRRLNLVMALIHDPEIVILDEPVVGLDPQGRMLVREYIRGLGDGKTVILTTHNMYEAELLSDRVAILDQGRLLVTDTPENLKSRVGLGDVIEIDLGRPEALEDAGTLGDAERVGSTLVVRVKHAPSRLPEILEALHRVHAEPGEVRIRRTSLEDVFIKMTGRMLRE